MIYYLLVIMFILFPELSQGADTHERRHLGQNRPIGPSCIRKAVSQTWEGAVQKKSAAGVGPVHHFDEKMAYL